MQPGIEVLDRFAAVRSDVLPGIHSGFPPGTHREGAMSTLITNIAELVTNAPEHAPHGAAGAAGFGALTGAALVIDDAHVAWCGPAAKAPPADEVVDAGGRAVLPGFVDSHAHLVFAGDRSAEFAARMAGRPYQAGGIASTVEATRGASDAQLRAGVRRLAAEMLRQGTTTFECKSGYGLNVTQELRSVRLAAEVTDEVTYLGAHVVPPEFGDDLDAYVDLVCGPMLAACAPHSRWVDVFCDRGAFGADEARTVLAAGRNAGLIPRVHACQLGPGPGVQVAVEAGRGVGGSLHLPVRQRTWPRSRPRAPSRRCCQRWSSPPASHTRTRGGCSRAGATVALATDCNPGSCFTSSMALSVALAVREMG